LAFSKVSFAGENGKTEWGVANETYATHSTEIAEISIR